jgi:hypothetical protein
MTRPVLRPSHRRLRHPSTGRRRWLREIGYGLAGPTRERDLVPRLSGDQLLAQPIASTVRERTLFSNAASRRVLEKAGFIIAGTTQNESIYERHA